MIPEISLPVSQIRSNYAGFAQIADLYMKMKNYQFSRIHLETGLMSWCDANMCAAFGAVLYRIGRRPNEITLLNMPADVETILCKNGFMTNYGRAKRVDTYGSTIQYQRFEPDEDRVFSYFIDEQFRNKAIPEMTILMHKHFFLSLMEIFENATTHSETKLGIFVCGQFFPKKNRLDFTIADLGIGMRQNLIKNIGLNLPAKDAIHWAMEGKNTTKKGTIPGGLGLKLIREFIQLNKGRLQVVSDSGYWEQDSEGRVTAANMPNPFPGTVVNIEINTADQNAYALKYELEDDIPF